MKNKTRQKKTASGINQITTPETAVATSVSGYLKYYILAIIVTIAALVHSSGLNNEFTNYDDDKNVSENVDVFDIAAENVQHFFTKDYMGVYVPLTMLSYAVDNKIGGMDAHHFHFTNLLLHLLNVCLVFFLILKLTGRLDAAGIATLLFAVHPVNAEAIAWITSRSSLLYSFFYLAALISYVYYLLRAKKEYLFFSILLFLFSALSKNAAAIFPFTLLLVDVYYKRKITVKTVAEKIPFFIISLIIGIITLRIRTDVGITNAPFTYSLIDQFFMACYSLGMYLLWVFVPFKLSAVYPYPYKSADLLPALYYVSPVCLLLILYALLKIKVLKRELLFGLVFFVINLLLVLSTFLEDGFVANRYAYIPYIGLFFIIGCFFAAVRQNIVRVPEVVKTALPFLLAVVILFFSVSTYARNKIWKDSITLWNDVLEKYPDTPFAYSARGNCKAVKQDYKAAIEDYNSALKLNPNFGRVYFYRALSEYYSNDYENSLKDLNESARLTPNYALVYELRSLLYINYTKDYTKAMRDCDKAINLAPDHSDAYNNRGMLKGILQRYPEAIADLNKAIEINPASSLAFKNRGFAYMLSGNVANGCADYSKAAELGNTEAAGLLQEYCGSDKVIENTKSN